MERYTKSLAKQAVGEYAAVAHKHGLTPTQLALAWCKSRWQVTSTIIGATSMEQLKVCSLYPLPVDCLLPNMPVKQDAAVHDQFLHVQENIGAFDIDLSEEALTDIDRVYKEYRDPTTTTKPLDD